MQGRSTVTEHVQAVLGGIQEIDPGLHAYVAVAGDHALQQAEAADRLIACQGESIFRSRPLLGTTLSVKDLIQTQDLPTRRGSLLPNHRAPLDAPAVSRLRAAGAIVVGKTATSEYGWSASTVSRVSPATRNPWDRGRSAGGSSGGSAAAVAAGLCTFSLGTDGAGSVRIPASFCGVVGFKPTFGRIPYVPAGPERLAHVGPLARTVGDILELMPILGGSDARDPDSLVPPTLLSATARNGGLRIGWLDFDGTAGEVGEVAEKVLPLLAADGHRIERTEVPFGDPYLALVDLLAASEALGTGPDDEKDCDPGRLALVRYGRGLSATAVIRAEQARLDLRARMAVVMDSYDALLMPTVPQEPFAAEAIGPSGFTDPQDRQWLSWTPATYPFNLTGQPALSVPAGLTDAGLPVGVQVVGRVGADHLVLSVGLSIETGLALDMKPALAAGPVRSGGNS